MLHRAPNNRPVGFLHGHLSVLLLFPNLHIILSIYTAVTTVEVSKLISLLWYFFVTWIPFLLLLKCAPVLLPIFTKIYCWLPLSAMTHSFYCQLKIQQLQLIVFYFWFSTHECVVWPGKAGVRIDDVVIVVNWEMAIENANSSMTIRDIKACKGLMWWGWESVIMRWITWLVAVACQLHAFVSSGMHIYEYRNAWSQGIIYIYTRHVYVCSLPVFIVHTHDQTP